MASGLEQMVDLSPELEAVVGAGPMMRKEVTSKLWEYIKSNGLQSEDDGRIIQPDATLKAVFDKVADEDVDTANLHMMKMTGIVSKHMTKVA